MHRFTGLFQLTDLDNLYHYHFSDDHLFGGHRHRAWEINVVLDGCLQVTYESRVILLRTGDVLLCEPDRFHRNCVQRGGRAELAVLQFYTDDLSPCGEARLFRMTPSGEMMLRALLAEFDAFCTETGGSLRDTDECPDVLRKLCESFLTVTLTGEAALDYGRDRTSEIYRNAVEYMKHHLTESLSAAQLARICCVSPSTLKNAFARCAGKGPIHYFNDLRLRRACQLLRGDVAVQEVSALLGYSSPSYFSQAFTAAAGCSPQAYKSRYRSAADQRTGSG